MLTGQSDPRLRRYRPLLALAAGLLIALAATSGAIALAARGGERTARSASCSGSATDSGTHATAADSDQEAGTAAVAATSATATSSTNSSRSGSVSRSALADDASTGLDLEVRIGRIRVEFPWLKTLPITPGRHIVFTLLPAFDTESR
jgi:hypothetical protein